MVVLKTTVFRSMNFRVNPNRAFGLYGSGKSGDMIPDVFYQQCWRTPLDPIDPDIVGRIDVKRILGDAKGGFIRRALRLITSYADHREILKERLELEVVALSGHLDREIPVLFTSQKWWTHIANLHQWGILIHVRRRVGARGPHVRQVLRCPPKPQIPGYFQRETSECALLSSQICEHL